MIIPAQPGWTIEWKDGDTDHIIAWEILEADLDSQVTPITHHGRERNIGDEGRIVYYRGDN